MSLWSDHSLCTAMHYKAIKELAQDGPSAESFSNTPGRYIMAVTTIMVGESLMFLPIHCDAVYTAAPIGDLSACHRQS